jgi:hypothetical protein
LPNDLTLQGLPPLNQPQPEGPVLGITSRSGKAAAFIGTPPEFVVRSGAKDFHREALRQAWHSNVRTKEEHNQGRTLATVFDLQHVSDI